jgi:hypothetical protein
MAPHWLLGFVFHRLTNDSSLKFLHLVGKQLRVGKDDLLTQGLDVCGKPTPIRNSLQHKHRVVGPHSPGRRLEELELGRFGLVAGLQQGGLGDRGSLPKRRFVFPPSVGWALGWLALFVKRNLLGGIPHLAIHKGIGPARAGKKAPSAIANNVGARTDTMWQTLFAPE